MTEAASQFRVVLRGYEPEQVDQRIEELSTALQEAARQRDDLLQRVETLEEDRRRVAATAVFADQAPTFEHLGARVGQILQLAQDEADELRRTTLAELDAKRAELARQVSQMTGDADHYAEGKRRDADTAAARIVEEARRLADERLESADRDAAARIQEAEAIYEEQRARSAKAAADFETTLAARRKAAEEEFAQGLAEANVRLVEASRMVDEARAEGELLRKEASQDARRIVDEAELRAQAIIGESKALAQRVRTDSERELAAATQRRDSINQQLANVRQMLATLTGTQPAIDPLLTAGPSVAETAGALAEDSEPPLADVQDAGVAETVAQRTQFTVPEAAPQAEVEHVVEAEAEPTPVDVPGQGAPEPARRDDDDDLKASFDRLASLLKDD